MPQPFKLGRTLLALALVAILAAASRLAVVATRLELGGELLAEIVQDATLGWIGRGHERIAEAPPERQAEFWLAEAQRIVEPNPTAELAQAAAWTLDAPALTLFLDLWQPPDPTSTTRPRYWDLDVHESFELLAREECLRYAALATALAPDDISAWRTRGLTLFQGAYNAQPARDAAGWPAVLAEAAQRDPDNSLYDFLAADQMWPGALRTVTTSNPDNPLRTEITKPQQHAAAREHLERGLARAGVAPLQTDWRTIADYLARSSIPRHEQAQLIYFYSLQLPYTRVEVLERLRSSLRRLEYGQSPADQLALAVAALRLEARFPVVDYLGWFDLVLALRKGDNTHLSELLAEQASELSAEEVQAALTEASRLEAATLIGKTAASSLLRLPAPPIDAFAHLGFSLATGWSLRIAVLLAAVATFLAAAAAAVNWASARYRGPQSAPAAWRRPVVRNLLAWLAALTATFLFLGVGPSEMFESARWQLGLRVLMMAIPAGLICAIMYWLLTQRRSHRVNLSLLVLLPLLGGMITAFQGPLIERFLALTSNLLRGRESNPWLMMNLQVLVLSLREPWLWAAVHWHVQSGPTVTALLAVTLVAAWYWVWTGRRPKHKQPGESPSLAGPPLSLRARLSGAAREAARSAGVAALVLLLVFLLAAPGYLRASQAIYTAQMQRFAEQEAQDAALAAAIEAIQADPVQMGEHQNWANQQLGIQPPP